MEPFAETTVSYKLTNDEIFESVIKIYVYTERSIAITTNEHFGRAFVEKLREIGTFNPKLSIGKGWVFSNVKYPLLQQLIKKIMDYEIKGVVPVSYGTPQNITNFFKPMKVVPHVVTHMSNLICQLSDDNLTGKSIFVDEDENKTYIWGNVIDVRKCIEEMQKPVKVSFEFNGNMVAII